MVKYPKRPRPEEPLHRQSGGGDGGAVVELAPSAFDRNAAIADEYNHDDDDEYSRYSSNYFADHNRNRSGMIQDTGVSLADGFYPPPGGGDDGGGRIAGAAAASAYDLPGVSSAAPGAGGCSVYSVSRSCSDYTAPFNDAEEWTPTDSAYGAAMPVFGWIPKPIRKIIEATFIFLLVLAFVVVVISASIKLQGEKKSGGGRSSSGSSGNGSYGNDDAVAAYNEYEENQAENAEMVDDYYGDDDDNADGGRRWRGRRSLLPRGPIEGLADYRVGEQSIPQWHENNSVKSTDVAEGTDAGLLRRRVGRTYLW